MVDDEKTILYTLQVFLKNAGYEVSTAGDVPAAQAHLAHADCDVVISDIVLPGASGVELLGMIRSASPWLCRIGPRYRPIFSAESSCVRMTSLTGSHG